MKICSCARTFFKNMFLFLILQPLQIGSSLEVVFYSALPYLHLCRKQANQIGKEILQSRAKGLCFFCSGAVCCQSRMTVAYDIYLASPETWESEFWQIRAKANLYAVTIIPDKQGSQGHRRDLGKSPILLQLCPLLLPPSCSLELLKSIPCSGFCSQSGPRFVDMLRT